MKETLQQFIERMGQVEQTACHTIGRSCYGNTRSVFNFNGMECYLESRGYRIWPNRGRNEKTPSIVKALWETAKEPSDHWCTDYMAYGQDRANAIAKQYGATIQAAWYAIEENTWFHFQFQTFEALCQFLYDRLSGAFVAKWGTERQPVKADFY